MADTDKNESKDDTTSIKSIVMWSGLGAILLFLLDQGRVMRRIFGPLWDMAGDSVSMAFKAVQEAAATIDDLTREAWDRLKKLTYRALCVISICFIVGISQYYNGGNEYWKVFLFLGGVGSIALVGLWVYAIRFVAVIGALVGGAAAATTQSLLNKIKIPAKFDYISDLLNNAIKKTDGLKVLPLVPLVFTIWLLCFTSPAGLLSALILGLVVWSIKWFATFAGCDPKKGNLFMMWVLIGVAAILLGRFFIDQAFPGWLEDPRNTAVKWIALLVSIPVTFLIISALASQERKKGWFIVAIAMAVLAGGVAKLLNDRGILTRETAAGKVPTKPTTTETVDETATASASPGQGSAMAQMTAPTTAQTPYQAPPSGPGATPSPAPTSYDHPSPTTLSPPATMPSPARRPVVQHRPLPPRANVQTLESLKEDLGPMDD